MRIAHVNYTDGHGGAGKAAKRLYYALQDHTDHDVIFVSLDVNSSEDSLSITGSKMGRLYYKFIAFVDLIISRLLGQGKETKSINLFPTMLPKFINQNNFDIVHFHWIGSGLISIKQINLIKAKIFWTFHDEWPILAMDHYQTNPSLHHNRLKQNFDNYLINKKKSVAKKIRVITPSNWLLNRVLDSDFNFIDVRCIPNTIASSFYNVNSKLIKALPVELKEKKVVLFATMPSKEIDRKGGDLLIKIFDIVKNIDPTVEFLTVGNSVQHQDIYSLPYIEDEDTLASIYSSVDLVAIPSRIDNLPNIGLESLFCGTRIVGFDVGGLSDIVFHESLGALAEFDNCEEFARLIVNMVNKKSSREEVSNMASEKWGSYKIAKEMESYYRNCQ